MKDGKKEERIWKSYDLKTKEYLKQSLRHN